MSAQARTYGYTDERLVGEARPIRGVRWIALALALLFLVSVWLALDQKLLFGGAWISETYDNPDWRTNEGNLHTFGAWDLEAHVWKTEFIIANFPNFQWNPYWYLGMPLLKYYQSGFYIAHWGTMALTGLAAPRAALVLIVTSHLVATLLTFLLCYKVSRRIWVSALCASFLLSNTFISLRSYGWEPITVVFLFLYPLGLLLFLKDPLRPLRFSMILVLAAAYLCHPLLWFSLCMTMGLYLLRIALYEHDDERAAKGHYIFAYVALVLASMLVGAVQFIPQMSYDQASSGAHMGVTYLPFYQVPPNIITLKDFFFDMGNLKGPGPIIMIALFLFAFFTLRRSKAARRRVAQHELVSGFAFVLFMMVLFYYLEAYNLFPMNFLRSIQYHRIIPEFIIAAAVLIAGLSTIASTRREKAFYYAMLVGFVLASFIVVYNVQSQWATTDDISQKPEFIYDEVEGRISFPYTDQSLSVRNSFTQIPQVYGYYEQGITNPYADELFSVSSGFHNRDLTLTYLQAANVGRLYVNMEEGERDVIMMRRLNGSLELKGNETGEARRYAYFEIPLTDPSFAQAVPLGEARKVISLEQGCREIFKEVYCGSVREEFVGTDRAEVEHLEAYVEMLDAPYAPDASLRMVNPDNYVISVRDASADTAVVVKMTHDPDFVARVGGAEVPIETIGPGFMLISPGREGDYEIALEYTTSMPIIVGAAVSATSLLVIGMLFLLKGRLRARVARRARLKRGDL